MSAKLFRGSHCSAEKFPWRSLPALDEKVDVASPGAEGGRVGTEPASALTSSSLEAQMEACHREMDALRREVETKMEAARQQGREDGKLIALNEVRAEREAVQKQLAQSLTESLSARRALLEHTDEGLVQLAVAIATKVLNRELHTDPEALRGIARAALDRIAGKEVQLVRMHPNDQEAVEKELGSTERKSIRLIADPSLARGTLLFETEFGILDCSASTQLEEIERGLTDRIRRNTR